MALPRRRQIAVVAALALAMPFAARAKPIGTFGYIVAAPGDQTHPSIDGNYVVYSGPAAAPSDGLDVLRADVRYPTAPPAIIAGGPGDQWGPDVFGTVVAYRGPLGVSIWDWSLAMSLRSPAALETVAAPSVGSGVAAWEFWEGSDRDVKVFRIASTEEYAIRSTQSVPRPGDQHAPAACGTFVAFIDEADGASVQLHDSTSGTSGSRLLCPGRATGVGLGRYGVDVVAAIARADGAYDEDVEVRDLAGIVIGQPLHVRGEQRNPHLSGEWVAFEDLSTLRSQVVLWQWTTGLVFIPHPSESNQTLNDLFAGDGVVRVVFADDVHGNLDIALYELSVLPSIPDDGLPSNWPPAPPLPPPQPATCAPGGGTQLAILELARDGARPEAGEYVFRGDGRPLPVLVCIDSQRVSAAWVALDDQAVATPSDFRPDVVHLEVRSAVDAAGGKVSAVLAGMPGATLTVRVVADPARRTTAASAASPALQAPAPSDARAPGCGTSGGGALGLAAAIALGLRRRRS